VALQPRRIFIDVQSRTFISSPFSNLPSVDPVWVDEDVEVVEIYALRPLRDPANPYAFVDLSAATVKFAVGATAPAALQTAFTPIPTTVTTTVTETQTGGSFGGTVDERQRITFSGATPYSGSYVIKFPERTITATVVGKTLTVANHGLYSGNIVRVGNLSGSPAFLTTRNYIVSNAGQSSFQLSEFENFVIAGSDSGSGTVDITIGEIITPAIPYNATITQIQEAIVAAGFTFNNIPQIIVNGENGVQLDLYYAGRNGQGAYPNVVIVNSSLKGAPGVTANVSYSTSEIAALIAAGTTNVTMEIEISEGAVRQTFRQSASLSPDLITSSSPSPLPANVSTTFDLQSANGSVFTFTVTNSGELMIAPVP
jgi:hypothetical protein